VRDVGDIVRDFSDNGCIVPTVYLAKPHGYAMGGTKSRRRDRNGIDTSTLWVRLREILPAGAQEAVGTVQLNIETMINMATAFAALRRVAR
jgi:hypothetical protein